MKSRVPQAALCLSVAGPCVACGDDSPPVWLELLGRRWRGTSLESVARRGEDGDQLTVVAWVDRHGETTDDEVAVRVEALLPEPSGAGEFEIDGQVRLAREYPIQVIELERAMDCSVLEPAQWTAQLPRLCVDVFSFGAAEYDEFTEHVTGKLTIERHDERELRGRLAISAVGLELRRGSTGAPPEEYELADLDNDLLFRGLKIEAQFAAKIEDGVVESSR